MRLAMRLGAVLALTGLTACAATPHYQDFYRLPEPKVLEIVGSGNGHALSEEVDISTKAQGDVVTVELFKTQTERFTAEDGTCYLSMIHANLAQGNWIKIDYDQEGWFFRARSTGEPVSGSARCVFLGPEAPVYQPAP